MESAEEIAPGGGVFHLYVSHEPGWRPRGNAEELQLGASTGRPQGSR